MLKEHSISIQSEISEITHSDWLKIFMWPATSNQSALFQHSIKIQHHCGQNILDWLIDWSWRNNKVEGDEHVFHFWADLIIHLIPLMTILLTYLLPTYLPTYIHTYYLPTYYLSTYPPNVSLAKFLLTYLMAVWQLYLNLGMLPRYTR